MTADTSNLVLRSLPRRLRDRLIGACDRAEIPGRRILDRVGETCTAVHFPETAVISTLATYSDGSGIEMANIGREACTGIGLVLGHPRNLVTNEAQLGGTALVMPAETFVEMKAAEPAFERALFSNVQAVIYQVMVSGACNGAHSARQRLARWLLTMRDRNDEETMRLTHDFLAEMLGVRRATVSEGIAELRGRGLVETSRGHIRVSDPAGLRGVSCECYDLVRDAYATLLPEPENGA